MSNQRNSHVGLGFRSHQFKVVLLGEGCVGKTSLVLRYVENKFTEQHQSTLQASFLKKSLTVEGSRVNLNIWDTAGQERFHALGPIYYRDSNGAILVYDVTDPDSLSKVKTWVKELKKMLGSTVCLAIVGNKTDLLTGAERTDPSLNSLVKEGMEYVSSLTVKKKQTNGTEIPSSSSLTSSSFSSTLSASSLNVSHYLTSAKQNKGIDELFLDLSRRMIQYYQETHPQSALNSNSMSSSGNSRVIRVAEEEEEETNSAVTSQRRCNC